VQGEQGEGSQGAGEGLGRGHFFSSINVLGNGKIPFFLKTWFYSNVSQFKPERTDLFRR